MVEMPVGEKMMNGTEGMAADVFLNGQVLIVVIGATVDDDAFPRFVADHKRVHLKGIAHKTLYIYHFIFSNVGVWEFGSLDDG